MKIRKIFTTILLVLVFVVSCTERLSTYEEPVNRLSFVFDERRSDTIIRQTFAYDIADVVFDTVWNTVQSLGYVTNYDRKVSFKALPSSTAQAERHYVPLDNEELTSRYYWLKAGQTIAKIPVVAKRDPSLKTDVVRLDIEITVNEDFQQGYPNRIQKSILMTDRLIKPSSWDLFLKYYFGGEYGTVKHQFMIDLARPLGVVVNDEWLLKIFPKGTSHDIGLISYWGELFSSALKKENQRRVNLGLDFLREEPTSTQTKGTIVQFTLRGIPQPYI